MLSEQEKLTIAHRWFDDWNRHDLEAILSHYEDDIEFNSPLVVKLLDRANGTLRGKSVLRDYFARGLATYPDLNFEPIQVLTGVRSIVLYYRSVKRSFSAEYMEISDRGLISKVSAHYTDP
ncbi:MAG: nuclear transport factor 2 family protein [Cyanobacteriota bacterium]|nr:nuclear transport factor 2 family protein [Cyanobacteriota bacterium]